jgi:MerR family copper efflux transcriptional regulator
MNKKISEEKLDDFLTVKEAAEFLGVSPSTLRNWDRSGKLEAIRHPLNGYRLYKTKELKVLLDQVREPNK